jgi:hypothetical protein
MGVQTLQAVIQKYEVGMVPSAVAKSTYSLW